MKKRKVVLCHHCGNTTPQKLLFQTTNSETVYYSNGEPFQLDYYHFLTQCETCTGLSLYASAIFQDDPENWREEFLVFPVRKNLPEVIPEKVHRAYMEASRISKIAPNAFAGQIRRALEYVCRDKQAKGHTLIDMVAYLAKQGIIPPTLAQMTDGIRILGNIGVHATDVEIDSTDVDTMDDFFKAILEYVYIGPYKISQLKDNLSKKKK
jgi:hypothetical protein